MESSTRTDIQWTGRSDRWLPAAAGFAALATLSAALVLVQPFQLNVVKYAAERNDAPRYLPALFFAFLIPTALVALSVVRYWRGAEGGRLESVFTPFTPMLLAAPCAAFGAWGHPPPLWTFLLLILGCGWAGRQIAINLNPLPAWRWGNALALASLSALLLLLVVIYTRLQINFFEHFRLGHADFGHFTEELKNALAGRGLRCDSFENTRFGWHFVPMLYVLVPGYALFPSPVYLMVCGALFVHLPSLLAYFLARRLSGSVLTGWMFATAWLLLPSQSRLVFSNTYGFQWIYFSMWLLGALMAATALGRWRLAVVIAVLLLLCKETAAAATLGWGLAVAIFLGRRAVGGSVAALSIVYWAVCTWIIIPRFAASGDYQRAELFGALGSTMGDVLLSPLREPALFFGRLIRREGLYFVATLLVSMAMLPMRRWRVAAMCIPTLGLVLLLENEQWLSIKFWHQCTILPILFFAAIFNLMPGGIEDRADLATGRGYDASISRAENTPASQRVARTGHSLALGVAAITCAALSHYFLAFSPIAKAFEPYAADTFMHIPDPKLEVVRRIRDAIPRDRSILATERLAAHFTDYRRLYTAGRNGAIDAAHFILLDAADSWDTSQLPKQANRFVEDPCFDLVNRESSIFIFARNAACPAVTLD
jgi:uncharacterized membrane protein